MDGNAHTTNGSLRGMPFQVAQHRILQFARPAFWLTLVLSLLSLCARGKLQGVLVGAFSGLLSLTLIKLFAYVLVMVFGVSLASNAIPIVSRATRWLGDCVAGVTFDCTSTALGVLVGMAPALAMDRSLVVAGSWLVFLLPMFLFIQLLLWSATNTEQVIVRFDLPRPNSFLAGLMGATLMITGIFSVWHEEWPEVHDSKPQCSHTEQTGQTMAPAAQQGADSRR